MVHNFAITLNIFVTQQKTNNNLRKSWDVFVEQFRRDAPEMKEKQSRVPIVSFEVCEMWSAGINASSPLPN